MPQQPQLRAAALGDIPTLVDHRRRMFEDIDAAQSMHYRQDDLDRLDEDYEHFLQNAVQDETLRAWVAEVGGEIVASGAVSVLAWPPCPGLRPGWAALLHSMYTAPKYRRQGIGRSIVEAAISFCKARGCRCIMLGARGSDAGRHLYETIGFRPSENMRLNL